MATKLEDLVIRLKADSTELERELRKSGVAVNRFSKQAESGFASISTAAKKIGATLAVAFAAEKLREFASAALELGGSLNDTAARLGTTAESLQIYRMQAKEAGVDSGAVDSSLQSFEKTLGLLQRGLGRATKQLALLDPELLAALKNAKGTDEAYRLVADSVKRMADAHQDARAASVAAATGMAPLLGVLKEGSGAFDTFGERVRASGLVLSNEAARGLDAFGEALERVKQTALVGFAEGLAGADAGAQSFTATLSDPEMLKGLHDFAQTLGEIGSILGKIAVGLPSFINSTAFKFGTGGDLFGVSEGDLQKRLGQLKAMQEAQSSHSWKSYLIPKATDQWQPSQIASDISKLQTEIDNRNQNMSVGSAWDMSQWTSAASTSPPPFGVAPPKKGAKAKENAAPHLDYSITHFDFFAAEKQAMKTMVDDYDKGMTEMRKSSAVFADEGVAHFEKMQAAAEAFGSFAGNVFGTFVREGKLDLKGLGLSFAQMLVEMEARALAAKLFDKITGSNVSGAKKDSTGFWIGLASSIAGLAGGSSSADYGNISGGVQGGWSTQPTNVAVAASGGYFKNPTLALIGEGGEGEYALPESKLRKMFAANSSKTVVNVHNYGTDQIKTQTRKIGDQEIIDVMVASSIRRQRSVGAMKDEFGRRHTPGAG